MGTDLAEFPVDAFDWQNDPLNWMGQWKRQAADTRGNQHSAAAGASGLIWPDLV